jgi:spermidine/putrescine-binding protein
MKRWIVGAFPPRFCSAPSCCSAPCGQQRHGPKLTVATWAGQYGHAQASALLLPFANRSGIDVRLAIYDGGTAELARQVATKQYAWDVVDLELPDAVAACRQGLLEPIDAATLPDGRERRARRAGFRRRGHRTRAGWEASSTARSSLTIRTASPAASLRRSPTSST